MASEKPVKLKKKKTVKQETNERICVIHNSSLNKYGEIKPFTEVSWKKIQEAKDERLKSSNASERKFDICEQVPQNWNKFKHGYHRPCYSTFTQLPKQSRKRQSDEGIAADSIHSPRKRREHVQHCSNTLFDQESCIFCQRKNKYVNRKPDILIQCVTDCAKESTKEAAKEKSDFRMISVIENSCLIAQQAHYHRSCQRDYVRKSDRHSNASDLTEEGHKQKIVEEAHSQAFRFISDYVQNHIIEACCVERVTMLKEKYLNYMQSHFPEIYNPQYKTYKLKEKLVKEFGNRIQFWQPNYKSELVYSKDVPKGAAIETAFEQVSSEERRLQEAALILRREIIATHKHSQPMPWPPSSKFLLSKQKDVPPLLFTFVKNLFSHRIDKLTDRCERRVISICQDIFYTVTNGQWKTPKHLLLGMSIRHITGSSKLINFLNRLGHCASHSTLLELETAMCDSVNESTSNLPAGAVKDALITHFCWDNFDMMEETPTGLGTTHSTHGIIIQESIATTDEVSEMQTCNAVEITKSKRRSAKYKLTDLEPCFVKQKAEPTINVNETHIEFESDKIFKKAYFLWMFCRFSVNSSLSGPIIPNWKGWLSATTEDKEEEQSLVNYMPPINASVNELSTIQKLLQVSMKITSDLGQQFTFVTFDLAVAKKAYDIVWSQPAAYKNVIIHLGAFHTTLSFLSAVGKLMRRSGFEEIVIEAGTCASGSLDSVLKGKHYNRAMRVHSYMLEALERLLFTSFSRTCSDQLMTQMSLDIKDLTKNLNNAEFIKAMDSDNLDLIFAHYQLFKEQVKSSHFGKTAKFWYDYMENVRHMIEFTVATKTNNFDMYVSSLQNLCPLLFCMNNHNYAKYLSLYSVLLINLPDEAKELMQHKGFSVSRSEVPAGRCAVDLTIEQTINKDAKTSGGIVGFSRSLPTYYRWCVTRHNRAQYVSALQQITNLDSNVHDSHKDLSVSEIKSSEGAVRSIIKAFSAFINPFEMDTEHLICLSSGKKVSDDIANDLSTVHDHGKKLFEDFVNTRIKNKTVEFKHPLPKSALKTFASATSVVAVQSKNKEMKVKIQRNLFGQLLVLSHEHDINMEKVLSYPLSPTPWSLATPDGLPLKTNKATLIHAIEKQEFLVTEDVSKDPNTAYVMDGMAFYHSLTEMPATFGDLAKKLLNSLPQTACIHFVTDTYKADSIKSIERARRGGSDNSFLLTGPAMKIPSNWKGFLSSDENKKILTSFLVSEIHKDSCAPHLLNRELYFVCEDRCELFTSTDGKSVTTMPVHDLFSSQEEADTRIILHCLHLSNQSTVNRIVIRSPDTDVFLLLLSFANTIGKTLIFDTGSGNHRRQINMSELALSMPARLGDAILGLHAFTGSDSTSCFAGKGKVRPLKYMKKDDDLIDTFARLGTCEHVSEEDNCKLEAFVCSLYGKPSYECVNKVRFDKVRQSFKGRKSILSNSDGVDLSQMPPCKQVLNLHIQRANYQTLVWRNSISQYPDLPDPKEKGWKAGQSGKLEIKWFCADFLPGDLQDILSEINNDDDDGGDEDENDTETEMRTLDEESSCSDIDSSDTDEEY